MKHMKQLWQKHKGQTVYIVGTGPSLRFFKPEFFEDKITIGLNEAYRHIKKATYNLTIHPELIPRTEEKRKQTGQWITKIKDWLVNYSGCKCLQEEFFIFKNNSDVKDFSFLNAPPESDKLYVGRGIHTAAMGLAARMGASTAILVGCDFAQIGRDHHAFASHVQFHGLESDKVYKEYYEFACKVRDILLNLHSVQFLTISPFLSQQFYEKEYEELSQMLKLPQLPPAKDVSKYTRTNVDFV